MKKNYFLLFLLFCIPAFSLETTFLLIRHGETQWNAEKRIQGHTNRPLNAVGHKQAEEIADKLDQDHPDITVIYSSDLGRAYETAEATGKKLNLPINLSLGLILSESRFFSRSCPYSSSKIVPSAIFLG